MNFICNVEFEVEYYFIHVWRKETIETFILSMWREK